MTEFMKTVLRLCTKTVIYTPKGLKITPSGERKKIEKKAKKKKEENKRLACLLTFISSTLESLAREKTLDFFNTVVHKFRHIYSTRNATNLSQ